MSTSLASHMRRQSLAAEHARLVANALLVSPESQLARKLGARSAAGDERRLRGIPVLGACAGAIPGTRPGVRG